MTAAPHGVSAGAWRAVLAEDVPPPGQEGRDYVNESPVTPADLTVLKLAVNGHQVSWIAEAAQTSIVNVQTVLTTYGPTRDDWQNAIDAHEQRPFDLPDGRPERTTVTRIDNRDRAEPPRLALVPPAPEPAMTAGPTPEHNQRCGQILTGGGAPRGWVLVRIIGQGTPRRYCRPGCAVEALSGPPTALQELVEVVAGPTPAPRPVRRGAIDKDELVRRYQAGETLPHIAEALGVTLPAVKGQCRAAIAEGLLTARGKGSGNKALLDRLAVLGVTVRDVKVWAVDQGLIPAIVRGLPASHLVDAYLDAHQNGAQTA